MSKPDRIDKYEIIEEIGRGGMAIVYKGLHPFLERYVAIKVLPEYFVQDKEFVDRFTREAKTMMELYHPNIVRIYDAGIYENKYFIVMDYIEGKTLKDLIRERGKLPIDYSINIILQISAALSYAHKKGIIHRDIKPSNILIENETDRAYITDFGIAKAVSGTRLTQTGVSLGTPEYMSPEQFSETGEVDERTDIYSLGVVFYEMLTGDIPFKGDTPLGVAFKHVNLPPPKPRIKNPKISPYLEKIVMKMLAKNINNRYKDMEELIEDINHFKNKNYDKVSALSFSEEGKGTIDIFSNPPGARIYIDGEYIGKTPLENYEVSIGEHKILLVKSGYSDYAKEINLTYKERETRIDVNLVKEKETLMIRKKMIESEESTRKIEESISPVSEEATRKIGMEKEEGLGKIEEEIDRGEKKKALSLKPAIIIAVIAIVIGGLLFFVMGRGGKGGVSNIGYLSITSIPSGAKVYIDNNESYIGITPIDRFEIEEGEHRIRLIKDGYEEYTTNVLIKSKEDKNISVTLKHTVITWERTYGGEYNEGASSIQQTKDGRYVVAGTTGSFGAGSGDFYIIKLDRL